MHRRNFLAAVAAAGTATTLKGPRAWALTGPPDARPTTAGAAPISREERLARIAKLQRLMADQGVGAMIVEPGPSLDYFTGVQWWRSERTTAAVIPARGEVVLVTPAFEEPSVRETLAVGSDVRPWNEHESPFARIVQALRDRGVASGPIAFEATTRLFIVDGVRQAGGGAYSIASGDGLVRACRMVKSPAELALMQIANAITLEAIRHAHAATRAGMGPGEISALIGAATTAAGGGWDGGLVLLNEASAYPHGSHQKQTVREGSVVLVDVGCTVHGYTSDISRTWIVGAPSARQRKVWATVKRGQEIALETARLGAPVGSIDDAVRGFYEKEGWGPGYRLPGLSHRTGHGIGLDGHESPYLVHGDATPLAPGMCFSDEPGLYIPGEFGIRLEDCWHMTEAGPKLFTPLARSVEDPI
ncbi:MAG TPA: Xaa-Pro peptidase family protein [Phenylobacterium sp.]|jgi:Xaa-Pro dipeptidase